MDCFLLLILYLVWKKLRVSPVLLLAFAFAALYWTQLALSGVWGVLPADCFCPVCACCLFSCDDLLAVPVCFLCSVLLSVVLSVCSESRVFSDSSDSLSKKKIGRCSPFLIPPDFLFYCFHTVLRSSYRH